MITIYGAENCSSCKLIVADYEKNGHKFKYVDVATLDMEEIQELSETYGRSLPIILEE